jgi:hypothetical protein
MSQLSELLDNLGLTLADLDMQQANKKGSFLTYLANLSKNRKTALQSGDNNISGRGLLQSGIALKQQVDTNTTFDNTQAEATTTQNEQLAAIARQRLQAEANYRLRKAELEAAAAAEAQPAAIAAAVPPPMPTAAIPGQEPITPVQAPRPTSTAGTSIVRKNAAGRIATTGAKARAPQKPAKPRVVSSNPLKVGVM